MSGPRTNAAYYAAPVDAFLRAADDEVYAPLANPRGYTLAPEQLSGRRLNAVLVTSPSVVPLS